MSADFDGQKFLHHAYSITAAVNSALHDPGLMRQDVHGTVRVGASPSMLAFRLRPLAGTEPRSLAVTVARYTPQAVLIATERGWL